MSGVRTFLGLAVLVLLGCETKPHHAELDQGLRDEVVQAMHAVYDDQGVPRSDRPARRQLLHTAAIYYNQARNAQPAYAGIMADEPDIEAKLRAAGHAVVEEFRRKFGAGEEPKAALLLLLDEPALDRGQRLLLLGLINQTAADGRLMTPDPHVRRFLDHPVVDDEPTP